MPAVSVSGSGDPPTMHAFGRRWVVRDRMWFGWPDPPEFVAIAFDGDEVWAAADFDNWPRKWTGVGLARSEAAGRHASVPE